MKKLIPALLAGLLLIGALPGGAAAGESKTGSILFESSVPDPAGCFEVTMTASNVTFCCIQMALRYDPEIIAPVDDGGERAKDFDSFAHMEEPWIMTIGTEVDGETGLIDLTVFTMYDTVDPTGRYMNDAGEISLKDENTLKLYTLRFKRLKDGDTGLQIATEAKGPPFQGACPEGVLAYDNDGGIPLRVVFREAEGPGEENTQEFVTPAPTEGRPERTAGELLEKAVVLKIGSHAAVVDAGVTAIYGGERSVTAYAHDDRTFVPVRFVAERLGARVDWDNDAQTVIVEKDGHRLEMAIGSASYRVDGEERELDAPAELTPSTGGNFRTMVPVRFVSEALGYQVEWDQARDLVIIAPPGLEWTPSGEAEIEALNECVRLLAMYSGFV